MILDCWFRVETVKTKKPSDFKLIGVPKGITTATLLKTCSGLVYSLTRCFSTDLLILSSPVYVDNFGQERRIKDNAGFRFGFDLQNWILNLKQNPIPNFSKSNSAINTFYFTKGSMDEL